jgi:hypothetical protein
VLEGCPTSEGPPGQGSSSQSTRDRHRRAKLHRDLVCGLRKNNRALPVAANAVAVSWCGSPSVPALRFDRSCHSRRCPLRSLLLKYHFNCNSPRRQPLQHHHLHHLHHTSSSGPNARTVTAPLHRFQKRRAPPRSLRISPNIHARPAPLQTQHRQSCTLLQATS